MTFQIAELYFNQQRTAPLVVILRFMNYNLDEVEFLNNIVFNITFCHTLPTG
jgi:hypothetical protein